MGLPPYSASDFGVFTGAIQRQTDCFKVNPYLAATISLSEFPRLLFLGYIKQKISKMDWTTIDELKVSITYAVRSINHHKLLLKRVVNSFGGRISTCLEAGGKHSDHRQNLFETVIIINEGVKGKTIIVQIGRFWDNYLATIFRPNSLC